MSPTPDEPRPPLVYALFCGRLYGTERMALHALVGLRESFRPLLLAPEGPIHEQAAALDVESRVCAGPGGLAGHLAGLLTRNRSTALITTTLSQALAARAVSALRPGGLTHLHAVHGGSTERDSYGRKRWVARLGVRLVAVSDFVRSRLVAHGVRPEAVTVVPNFIPSFRSAGPRQGFRGPGERRGLVVSRLDPQKEIDVLVDALLGEPGLCGGGVRVLGTGPELEALRARCGDRLPGLSFEGFRHDVDRALRGADFLIHPCSTEPFGLAIAEALAAGLPAVVPTTGGASGLVREGLDGLHFRAGDAGDLLERLREMQTASPESLDSMSRACREHARESFSPEAPLRALRLLLGGARDGDDANELRAA